MPPIGELAEITVALVAQATLPVVPNASIQRVDGQLGVWVVDDDGNPQFTPIRTGVTDLEGRVQIIEGLNVGQRIVVYSEKVLAANSRIEIVDRIVGSSP